MQRAKTFREVGPQEAQLARRLGLELRESRLRRRVAVDADQRSGGPEPLGDQPRVPARPEGAVDSHLPRLRGRAGRSARRRGRVRVRVGM